MTKVEEILIELLKAGLGFTEAGEETLCGKVVEMTDDLSPDEWADVQNAAKRHGVTGIAYDAVARMPAGRVPAKVAATWFLEAKRIEAANKKSAKTIETQQKEWEKNDITAILQKGLSVAALYPVPEHRSCGDIDWYLPKKSDWKKAKEVVRSKGIKFETDSDGDIHYELAGVPIEHHRQGLDTSTSVNMLVMLNQHFMKHAMVMGIGLRHVCDLAVAYRLYDVWNGSEVGQKYYEKMDELGLQKWTRYLDHVIDFQDNALMELVLADGNMGKDKKNRLSGFRKRRRIFMRYAPAMFVDRWFSLAKGRIKRRFLNVF